MIWGMCDGEMIPEMMGKVAIGLVSIRMIVPQMRG